MRFAQKACSNTHILRLMRAAGVKVDSVSLGEIERALAAGYQPGGDEIVFTADLFDQPTLERVTALKVPVNAGSIDMLHQLGAVSPGHAVWLRVNPGFGHGHSQKTNTGGENSKHGIWHADLAEALAAIKQHGLQLVGIHMHIGSGVDYAHLQQVCDAMVELVMASGQDLTAISAGGGLSVPYRYGEEAIDTDHYFGLWDAARQRIAQHLGHAIKLEIEPGRFLVAEAGVGRDAFSVAQALFGRLTGGLGVATVGASAIFAAITGISIAAAAVFSRIAAPEMIARGYAPRFAAGVVAGASVLGMLIPPSLLLILYAILAEQSVGDLFVAGILPGLLLAFLFGVLAMGLVRFAPDFAGRPERGAPGLSPGRVITRS